MKTKIFFLIFIGFLVGNIYAQKVYIPSLQKYAKIVDYIDDTQKDLSKYSGDYLLIYPGYDKNDNNEGDAYLIQLELRISNDGKYVTASQTLQIPEKEAVKTSNLTNPSVFGNTFSSDEMTGKFVVLKYKKKDVTFSVKGILKKHTKDDGYDFYEKTK
ncbi:MAG: hypothetical protein NTU73_07040 [Ignavibacteriae bacterium]|nr:hypothetical protein [Ignavibacteriota bacterium]